MKFNDKKNINAILFYTNKSSNKKINRLKLMKLLWLADRIHLNRFGRLILKDIYNALPLGPIPSAVMNYSNQSQEGAFDVIKHTIKAISNFDPSCFSKSDLDVMEEVWEKYGERDGFDLKDYSHNFPEWKRFEKELNHPCSPNSYRIILDDFFENPEIDDYPYNKEESESSKSKYHIHSAIQSSLL